jgi:hypothetical protein
MPRLHTTKKNERGKYKVQIFNFFQRYFITFLCGGKFYHSDVECYAPVSGKFYHSDVECYAPVSGKFYHSNVESYAAVSGKFYHSDVEPIRQSVVNFTSRM